MAFKYIGKGDWIPGVPARDLTDAEVKQFGEVYVLASKLYVKQNTETRHETVDDDLKSRSKKTWRE